MTIEAPTLKIRVKLPDGVSHLGRDCEQVAKSIVDEYATVLDAAWSHPPTAWRERGCGWGRPDLTSHQEGYVDACRELGNDTVKTLVHIIDSLTGKIP